jgi:hypothetical protein
MTITITKTTTAKTNITEIITTTVEVRITEGKISGVDAVDSAQTISGAEKISRSWSFWRRNMRRINGCICKLGFITGGDAWLMRV